MEGFSLDILIISNARLLPCPFHRNLSLIISKGYFSGSILLFCYILHTKSQTTILASWKNMGRMHLNLPNVYTPICWYAAFPNHYAGGGDEAAVELGKLVTEHIISQMVIALKAVKADTQTLALQKEFFDRVKKE